ncbi:MAG: LptF/LptG family permease [Phycisphaerae bacterium]
MLKTLHSYISKELVKITLMTGVALTLLMTILAIIEPLRKQGLGTGQVLTLFGYTLPVMLTLTLPVASLFAATMVYGKFSQDNELTACKASGIGSMRLLRPAMVLGLLVTVTSLSLNNYVTPKLAAVGEEAVKANIRSIAFHKLKSEGSISYGDRKKYVIHADTVDSENDILYGVVAQMEEQNDTTQVLAKSARLQFTRHDGQWYVSVKPRELVGPVRRDHTRDIDTDLGSNVGFSEAIWLESIPLPSPTQDEPEWYTWDQLQALLKDPSQHGEIRSRLAAIQRRLAHHRMMSDVREQINAEQKYLKLADKSYDYRIEAAGAELASADPATLQQEGFPPAVEQRKLPQQGVLLAPKQREGEPAKVIIRVVRVSDDGTERVVQTITGDYGLVEASWSALQGESTVTLHLFDSVAIRRASAGGSDASAGDQRAEGLPRWTKGGIALPEDVKERVDQYSRSEIFRGEIGDVTDEGIRRELENLRTEKLDGVRADIIAEMHARLAYGSSCLFMVMLGAAMGMIFRGGQLIVAVGLSALPTLLVIVLVVMGKQMICNPDSPMEWGIGAMWAGPVVLVVMTMFAYLRLARE